MYSTHADPRLSHWLVELFHAVQSLSMQPFTLPASPGSPSPATPIHAPVSLSRFDLFHGHLITCHAPPRQPAILLHAAEYPALHPDYFPYYLGHCQHDSDVDLAHRPQLMDFRNFLWIDERIYRLNCAEGSLAYDT